jgi:hypothetical protein
MSPKVREQVQTRAKFMCEFCKIPDSLGFVDFDVDYIEKLTGRANEDMENLAWVCLPCMYFKRQSLSAMEAGTIKPTEIFQPRQKWWTAHFRLSEGLAVPKTTIGRATVFLVKINLPQTSMLRKSIQKVDPEYAGRVVRHCI